MTTFLQRYSQGDCQIGRDWFHPLSGWFLVSMMRLEDARPGILAFATRASPVARSAIAMALAAGIRDKPETFLLRANGFVGDDSTDAQIAEALMAMKPALILDAALETVPPALLGTLKKIGSSLLNTADGYVRLHGLMSSDQPDQQARARVLEKLDARLDDELIQVVEILDLAILTPKSAMAVRTATEAHTINARLSVIKQLCSSATDESLRQSFEHAPHFQSNSWVRGWLRKADRLPRLGIALDDEPGIKRIMPANAQSMGREWKNCLAGHSNTIALGATAYFAISDLNVIVILTRTDGGWLLSGIHGRFNMPVRTETAEQVKGRLSGLGVICLMPVGPPPELAVVAGVFHGVDDLEFGFQGMGG